MNMKTIVIKLVLSRLMSIFKQTYPMKCPPLDPIKQVMTVVIISRVLRFLWTSMRNVRLEESAISPAKLLLPLVVLLLRTLVLPTSTVPRLLTSPPALPRDVLVPTDPWYTPNRHLIREMWPLSTVPTMPPLKLSPLQHRQHVPPMSAVFPVLLFPLQVPHVPLRTGATLPVMLAYE